VPTIVNQVSAFTIRELSGERRTVRLVDRALPYRPFELETSQRGEITWLPGNPVATITVLGAEEDPTTINGFWKDKYLGQTVDATIGNAQPTRIFPIMVDSQSVNNVLAAVSLMDDIVRQGQLIEVSWHNQTRQGLLQKFRKRFHNSHDVEWEMDFLWSSRGEPTATPVFTTETSISDTTGILTKQNTTLQNNATFQFPVGSDFQEALVSLLQPIDDATSQAADVATQLTRLASTPFDAGRRLIATCTALENETTALVNFLQNSVAGTFNNSAPLQDLTFAERLVAYAYADDMVRAARDIKRTATLRRITLANDMQTQLLAVYTAREGDNLRDVAIQFYQTAFEWRRLLTFNNLDTAELVGGQVVLVPKIGAGDDRM